MDDQQFDTGELTLEPQQALLILGLDHLMHDGGGAGEAGLDAALAGSEADADGGMCLARAGQANDRLPAFWDLRFGFVIRFILGRDRWCRWSRDRVMAGPRI